MVVSRGRASFDSFQFVGVAFFLGFRALLVPTVLELADWSTPGVAVVSILGLAVQESLSAALLNRELFKRFSLLMETTLRR